MVLLMRNRTWPHAVQITEIGSKMGHQFKTWGLCPNLGHFSADYQVLVLVGKGITCPREGQPTLGPTINVRTFLPGNSIKNCVF